MWFHKFCSWWLENYSCVLPENSERAQLVCFLSFRRLATIGHRTVNAICYFSVFNFTACRPIELFPLKHRGTIVLNTGRCTKKKKPTTTYAIPLFSCQRERTTITIAGALIAIPQMGTCINLCFRRQSIETRMSESTDIFQRVRHIRVYHLSRSYSCAHVKHLSCSFAQKCHRWIIYLCGEHMSAAN